MAAIQVKSMQTWSRGSVQHQNEEEPGCDFDRGMIFGVRRSGLSTADLMGFLHRTVS